jgi:hypothetical protein
VLRSTLVGATVGIPAIVLMAREFGSSGGAGGFALSELLVFVLQLKPAIRVLSASEPG